MILTIPPFELVEVNEVDFDVCCIGPGCKMLFSFDLHFMSKMGLNLSYCMYLYS